MLLVLVKCDYPVRKIHGGLSSCLSNSDFCVETGSWLASLSLSLPMQARRACLSLDAQKEELENGFILVGFGQGGLIARHVLHHCNSIGAWIKALVMVDVPHFGTLEVDKLGEKLNDDMILTSSQLKEILPDLPVSVAAKLHLELKGKLRGKAWEVPGELKGLADYWIKNGVMPNFLKDLNDKKWAPLYSGLESFVNIVPMDGSMFSPETSALLGAERSKGGRRKFNENTNMQKSRNIKKKRMEVIGRWGGWEVERPITKFVNTSFAQEAGLGIKQLFERGAGISCLSLQPQFLYSETFLNSLSKQLDPDRPNVEDLIDNFTKDFLGFCDQKPKTKCLKCKTENKKVEHKQSHPTQK